MSIDEIVDLIQQQTKSWFVNKTGVATASEDKDMHETKEVILTLN